MTKSDILAMDIGQKSAVVQLDRDGTRRWRATVPTTTEGWAQLDQQLRSANVIWSKLLVIVEATGVYHLPWVERLVQTGASVRVLNPLLSARLESAANALRGHKTDRVDVAKLAEVGRLHDDALQRFTYRSDPARIARRQMDSSRARLRELLTNLKKSVQSHVELVFPALLAAGISPDSATGARVLAAAKTAGQWQALPASRRRELALTRCAALDAACADTLANEALATAAVPALSLLLHTLDTLSAQLQDCERRLTEQANPARVQLISSIPGFGPRTAVVCDTYLPPNFEHWGNKRAITAKLQAFFGTDPRLRSSGQWTGKVKISKRGIRSARTALFQSAFCSLHADQENAAYYRQLRARGKSHKAAIVDVMRKQLRRLVAVLVANQPFVPRQPTLASDSNPCAVA